MSVTEILLLGAVAYDPKVVTIWEGFKAYFARHDLPFDYILYSNYERQVEAHLAGHFHVAWNSPLAWVRTRRLAASRGHKVEAVAMRDTDCDLTSIVVVRNDSDIQSVGDLRGKRVAVGAVDSPQATLLPLSHLRAQGLVPDEDFEVIYNDLLGGKHGDHIGGEREAARSLMSGEADAACMIDGNYLLFVNEGTLPAGATRVLTQTAPYDHCNFTVSAEAPAQLVGRFRELLLGMSYDDPEVRPLLDLEGLKVWREGRVEGYAALERAADEAGFYDASGNISIDGYRY
ncbi:MAG TPA: phosphate/phosphite/phosphonate ABC transporter substrate-binding protein [Pyrinomonadaceae bacterium]|nr:phosphate/phosphite/phosphonate ABC transporter substrate-binding protein [Pyrinomonadaceae bacterium]